MTVHHFPSPDRIIEAHRDTQVADDKGFWIGMCWLWVAFIAVPVALFLVTNGISRAFDRPEACRHLSAVECTALLQGDR